MPAIGERLFGSVTRTRVLVSLAALGETYPREISALIEKPLVSVQRILADLEDQGVVQSRMRGTVRLTSFTQSSIVLDLKTLLYEMLEADSVLSERVSTMRRRPRAPRKKL